MKIFWSWSETVLVDLLLFGLTFLFTYMTCTLYGFKTSDTTSASFLLLRLLSSGIVGCCNSPIQAVLSAAATILVAERDHVRWIWITTRWFRTESVQSFRPDEKRWIRFTLNNKVVIQYSFSVQFSELLKYKTRDFNCAAEGSKSMIVRDVQSMIILQIMRQNIIMLTVYSRCVQLFL